MDGRHHFGRRTDDRNRRTILDTADENALGRCLLGYNPRSVQHLKAKRHVGRTGKAPRRPQGRAALTQARHRAERSSPALKRIIVITLAPTLPLVLCVPVLQAEQPGPNAAKDASEMPESGPAVVGGTGATAGPNYKNQAIVPMPGLEQQEQEQLSERPPAGQIILPEIRPITGSPPVKR